MRTFIVISCLVLATIAKPQGYTYNPPSNGLSLSLIPPTSSSFPVSFEAITDSNVYYCIEMLEKKCY